jgi:hypothetical protein
VSRCFAAAGAGICILALDSIWDACCPSRRCLYSAFPCRSIDFWLKQSLQQSQEGLNEQLVQQSFHWMVHWILGLQTGCSLSPILEVLVASNRVARGNADLADDIRVLDGKRFLELSPLIHSMASEELAIAGPQPIIWNAASSMTCFSELISMVFLTIGNRTSPTSSLLSGQPGAGLTRPRWTKRPAGPKPLRQRRSCGTSSWKPRRFQPEEFPQRPPSGASSLLDSLRGCKLPCSLSGPTN